MGRGVWVPAFALGSLHICEGSAGDEDLEASHSDVEGDWSRWPMRGVACPPAELGDDPCGPGESIGAMVVLLKLGPTFQGLVDGPECFDLFRREDESGRQFFATVARLNELNDDTCHFGGDRYQLDQAFGAFELAFLNAQTLVLQRTKQLFDDPALLVPGDDPPSIGGGSDRMSGQEQPMNGLGTLWRVQFDDFNKAGCDACWQILHPGARRPLEYNGPEAHGEMGLTTTAIHPLRQIDHCFVA